MTKWFAWIAFVLCAILPSGASAAQIEYGSFVYDDSEPDVLFLGYPITPASPLDFGRAMRAHPGVVALIVFSEGGDVTGSLVIAEQVHDRGLATIVLAGTGCYSACAFIFFAGTPRFSAGEVGVHQFSGGSEDMSSVQYSVAEIVDALNRFGTPPSVLADMFRTTPDDMFVYSPQDAIRLGLNTADAPPKERKAETEPEADSATTLAPDNIGQSPLDLGPIEFSDIFASSLSGTLLSPDAPDTFHHRIPSPAAIYLAANGSQAATPRYGQIWWTRDVDGHGDATMVAELTVQLGVETLEAKITWQKNHDERLPAESTMTAYFHHVGAGVPDEVAGMPGVLAKSEAMVVGTPLVGASAKVRDGEFIFAGTEDEPSSTENAMLLNERYIDVAITLESGRNAILTLEKDDTAHAAFREVMESWVD